MEMETKTKATIKDWIEFFILMGILIGLFTTLIYAF